MLHDDRLPERFWDKVQPEPNTGCWLWSASCTRYGYGQLNFGGRPQLAHLLAYRTLVGEVPAGMQLDHKCRTRSCCNPDHLRPATQAQNSWNQPGRGGRSRFKGVSWHMQNRKWRARIRDGKRRIFLGCFDDEVAAALEYDKNARRLHGEFAMTNRMLGLLPN